MDFYHTNFWANSPGRYNDWHSIYPIFTFWIGQLMSSAQCATASNAAALRTCAPEAIWLLFASYLLGAWICAASAVRQLNRYQPVRWWVTPAITAMILMAMPGLFALERGNYIILAFVCLATSEWFGRNWKGALFLAFAINLKQYLILLWFVPFIKRRYDYLLISILFALIINQFAMIFIQDDQYGMLFENMLGFSNTTALSFFEKMWYATSFSAWTKGLAYSPYVQNIPPFTLSLLTVIADTARYASLLLVCASFALIAYRAHDISWGKSSLITLVAIMVATDSIGGYAIILAIPVTVVLLCQNRLIHLLPLFFILVIPFDITIGPYNILPGRVSYLSHQYISHIPGLTLGTYLRPPVLFLLLILLTYPLLIQSRTILRNTKSIFPTKV
ncbi:MAG: hypothetical protein IT497_10830 [Ottowia sp.]|nr:hypothetical protein [Ottowia sp.]